MKRRNFLIIIVSAVVLVVFIAMMNMNSFQLFGEKNKKTIHINISDNDIRVGEDVNFSVSDVPESSSVTWYVNGEQFSNDHVFQHSFDSSAYYTIKIEAEWDDVYGEASQEIGVKNEDYHNDGLSSRMNGFGSTVGSRIGPEFNGGISIPTVSYQVTFTDIYGSLVIYCAIHNSTSSEDEYAYLEEYYLQFEDFSFNKVTKDFTIEDIDAIYQLSCGFELSNGRWSSLTWEAHVEF